MKVRVDVSGRASAGRFEAKRYRHAAVDKGMGEPEHHLAGQTRLIEG